MCQQPPLVSAVWADCSPHAYHAASAAHSPRIVDTWQASTSAADGCGATGVGELSVSPLWVSTDRAPLARLSWSL
ncbi:MAG: hypothetical protein ACPIOQ_20100 [Promethearchaeia archaeon]